VLVNRRMGGNGSFENLLSCFGNKQEIAVVVLLELIKDFEGFDGFEKVGKACQDYFRCMVDCLVQITKMNRESWI
jgi:hypothetical protein